MDFGRLRRFEDPSSAYGRHGPKANHGIRLLHAVGISLVLGLVFLLTAPAVAVAGGRVALVMVAENYQNLPRSSVGLKRGHDIADGLTARGFDVVLSPNPSNAAARAVLRDFSTKAADADLALAVMIGHGTAWGGQTFFLPANAEIGRATDLLSRALSVTNVAQIAGRAKTAGVFVFMTTPEFGSPIEGLDPRPQFAGEIGKNAFAAFSTSTRVPVSRVDATSEQAADALARVLQQQPPAPSLGDAVKAAASGGGAVFGTVTDVSLAKPPPAPAAPPAAATAAVAPAGAATNGAMESKLEAERKARELAEQQARDEQVRAEQAQAQLQKAQADARRAQAEAEQAQAEADKAKLEARQIAAAQAKLASTQAESPKPATVVDPVADAQLGQKQRLAIQKRLHELGLYTGPLDAIMGPLTREAIMGFQKSRGASATGYLTGDQYEALLVKPQ